MQVNCMWILTKNKVISLDCWIFFPLCGRLYLYAVAYSLDAAVAVVVASVAENVNHQVKWKIMILLILKIWKHRLKQNTLVMMVSQYGWNLFQLTAKNICKLLTRLWWCMMEITAVNFWNWVNYFIQKDMFCCIRNYRVVLCHFHGCHDEQWSFCTKTPLYSLNGTDGLDPLNVLICLYLMLRFFSFYN